MQPNDPEKPINVGSKKAVRKRRKTLRDQKRQEKEDILSVIGTPAGRRVIFRILSRCGVYRTITPDIAARMGFYSGMQDVGHFILQIVLDARPDAYILMQQEAKENQ